MRGLDAAGRAVAVWIWLKILGTVAAVVFGVAMAAFR